MYETRQDPNDIATYRDEWNKRLLEASKAAGTTLTITFATVVADHGAVISDVTPELSGVLFRLSVASVPLGTNVTTTTVATLSNGDTATQRHQVHVALT